MIDAIKGHHLWSERYDRNMKDIFAVQDEITMKIITAMRVKLTEGEQARVLTKGAKNLKAYLKWLEAIWHMRQVSREGNILAKQAAEEPTDAISLVKKTLDLKKLDKLESDAEKTIDFVDDNPDGFTLNEGKENERFMDRDELIAMRKNARAALKAAKQRRQIIEQKND